MPYRDPEKAKENAKLRQARYRLTEKGKLARKKANQRYAEAHPEKVRAAARIRNRRHYALHRTPRPYVGSDAQLARAAVRDAVKWGRLTRQPCSCGLLAHAHHPNGYDLAHRLDVVWLCPVHHAAAHKAARERLP